LGVFSNSAGAGMVEFEKPPPAAKPLLPLPEAMSFPLALRPIPHCHEKILLARRPSFARRPSSARHRP
jgi:hypothetical protein